VLVSRSGKVLKASCPEPIRGLVEARSLGLIGVDPIEEAELFACVDMDQLETARLPQLHEREILGITLPELRRVDAAHFAPGLLQFLKSGQRRI
jgi:HPr kinase/phosphorylase